MKDKRAKPAVAPAQSPPRRLAITTIPARLSGVSAEFVDQLRKVGARQDLVSTLEKALPR